MSLIPAFDGLATAITDESECLRHFAIGLTGGFWLCFSGRDGVPPLRRSGKRAKRNLLRRGGSPVVD
jgi:hypothetical protein